MDPWIDEFGKMLNDKDQTKVNHDTNDNDKMDHGKKSAGDNDEHGNDSNDDNVDKDPATEAVGHKTASQNNETLVVENLDNEHELAKANLEQVMQNIANKTSTFAAALQKVADSMIPKAEDVAMSLKNRADLKEEHKAIPQNILEQSEKPMDSKLKKPVDDTEWLSPWITAHLIKANAFKAIQA